MQDITLLSNLLTIIVFIGGPIIPLLFLALRADAWYAETVDPTFEDEGHGEH